MDKREFLENLTKKYSELYEKMMPFEKSQFHQCIPNPDPEKQGELITVQLVKKVLHEWTEEATTRNVSQQYQNFTIEPVHEDHLNWDNDALTGVYAKHFSKVIAVNSESSDALDEMTTCEQYAVIASWGLHPRTDCFKCDRFFFVPNPYKRRIRNSEEAELSQVLYSSPHTNDVFLCFRGYHAISPRTLTMQCVILDLSLDKSATSRDIKNHCKRSYAIDESSLLG